MKEFKDKKKVLIPCRFSFLHCWEPDSVNGSEPKYSVSAIIPKSDTKTIAAINAINAIPDKVSYEDRAIVEAARAAYDKIATLEQRALVTNYDVLVSAEQRILALTPPSEEDPGDDVFAPKGNPEEVLLLFSLLAVIVLMIYCLQGVLKKEEPVIPASAE